MNCIQCHYPLKMLAADSSESSRKAQPKNTPQRDQSSRGLFRIQHSNRCFLIAQTSRSFYLSSPFIFQWVLKCVSSLRHKFSQNNKIRGNRSRPPKPDKELANNKGLINQRSRDFKILQGTQVEQDATKTNSIHKTRREEPPPRWIQPWIYQDLQ